MKVLIVHAHPEPKSFSTALKSVAMEEFESGGHEVRVSDLYAMHFNPVASANDFTIRADPDYCVYALEQRHGVKTQSLAEDIQAELQKLLWCDLLVLNFPVFWFSTPAILKGWLDRVFVSGVTYGGKRFYERGGLNGKRALISVTLGGQEHMFDHDGIHGPLQLMLKHLLQGTLAYTGFQVHEPFVGWHVPYVSSAKRREILEQWRTRIGSLESEAALQYPHMNDFDENLRRLTTQS